MVVRDVSQSARRIARLSQVFGVLVVEARDELIEEMAVDDLCFSTDERKFMTMIHFRFGLQATFETCRKVCEKLRVVMMIRIERHFGFLFWELSREEDPSSLREVGSSRRG